MFFVCLVFCLSKWCTYNAIVLAGAMYAIQPCTSLVSFQAKPHTQAVCVFSSSLPPSLLAKERDLLRATAETRRSNGHRNKSQNRKLSLAKEVFVSSGRSCRDSIPRPLDHESSTLPLNSVVVGSLLTSSVSCFDCLVNADLSPERHY